MQSQDESQGSEVPQPDREDRPGAEARPGTVDARGMALHREHRDGLGLLLLEAPGLGGELREVLLEAGLARRGQRDAGSRLEWCPHPVSSAWVKGGRLRLESAVRHGLRRLALGRPFPRLREFENLVWLREHGFLAPRPLLAGLGTSRGRAVLQFLATEWVPDAPSLADLVRLGASSERLVSATTEVGRLLARLHAAGFEHRDAYARNFVLDASGRPWVLDTWRGGPIAPRDRARAIARDRADFEADAASLLPPAALAAFRATRDG